MDELLQAIERFNFWNNPEFKSGFSRTFYLDKISKYQNNSLVKVLVGQRRSGKSYILRQIAEQLIRSGVSTKNVLFINKEFLEFDAIQDYKDLDQLIRHYKAKLKPKGKVYLFIDEIQNIRQWERLVNSYSQDYTESYELFISGSNSKMLSGELSSLLSGRYISFEIFPFSYAEYLGVLNLERGKASFIEYLQTGGLPELFHLPDEESKRHYVSAIKDTVLLRDIIQRQAIKDPKLLEDLFIYLINTSSNLLSINNIANYFKSQGRKTSFDTISNYIGFIEDSFLVHHSERFDIRGKETIAGNAKYYSNDQAYRNYLFGGYSHGSGYQLENIIFIELKRQGFQVYTGVLPQKEVDFVAQRAERVMYVQCAYLLADEATIKREYSALNAISDHYEKWVLSLDDISFPVQNGIRHVQAWQFDEFLK
jgi:predicted AAA+ superfamily ATPase